MLNIIGDSGGIDTAAMWIGGKVVSFFWSFYVTANIVSRLYRKKARDDKQVTLEEQDARTLRETKQAMKDEFSNMKAIKPPNPFSRYLGRCCKKSKWGKEMRF